MRYYFNLQLKRLQRIIEHTGIPMFGFLIAVAVLYYFAYHAVKEFDKYAPYALLLLCILILERTNQKDRIEFLRNLFVQKEKYTHVRLIENILALFPIVFLAGITGLFWMIPIMVLFGCTYAFLPQVLTMHSNKVLPTPFGKYPFEMIRYFRIYFLAIIGAIFLFGMGIISDNPNLALFGIALIPLLCTNHLENIEPLEVLWNYNMKPSQFLWHKIKRITLQNYLLMLPLSLILPIANYSIYTLLIILAVSGATFLLITLFLLMKYSIYPRKIGLLEGIIFSLTGLFLPLLFGLYPYYYKKAIDKLNEYL